jgi:hypothetical protein
MKSSFFFSHPTTNNKKTQTRRTNEARTAWRANLGAQPCSEFIHERSTTNEFVDPRLKYATGVPWGNGAIQ